MHGRRLAEISAESDHLYPLILCREFVEPFLRTISGAVVHKQDFPRLIELRQHRQELVVEKRDVFDFVVNGNDNGNGHGRILPRGVVGGWESTARGSEAATAKVLAWGRLPACPEIPSAKMLRRG